jgi:hypothetical protein
MNAGSRSASGAGQYAHRLCQKIGGRNWTISDSGLPSANRHAPSRMPSGLQRDGANAAPDHMRARCIETMHFFHTAIGTECPFRGFLSQIWDERVVLERCAMSSISAMTSCRVIVRRDWHRHDDGFPIRRQQYRPRNPEQVSRTSLKEARKPGKVSRYP